MEAAPPVTLEDTEFDQDETYIIGGDADMHVCAICLSTGFKQTYSLFGGLRVLLDSDNIDSADDWDIDSSARPFCLNGSATSGYVAWKVVPPKYFDTVTLRVFNNIEEVKPLVEAFDGVAWRVFTGAEFVPGSIRVSTSDEVTFTHIELVYTFTPKVLVQLPPMARQETFDMDEAEVSFSMVLPGLTEVTVGSVIYEAKYGRLWRVTGSTPNKTRDGKLFGSEVDVRLIHRHEVHHHLADVTPAPTLPYQGIAASVFR
jgi:hypothetical protein